MQLYFTLENHGWLDIHVTDNVTDDFTNKTSSYLISASYLTD